MRKALTVAVAFFAPAILIAAGPDDTAIAGRLIGKWTTSVAGGSSTKADGTIRYEKGGKFVAAGVVALGGGEKADVRIEGTWKVEDETILYKVKKSSHPGLAPVGGEMREKVLSLDEKTLKVRRGVGHERERKRVGD